MSSSSTLPRQPRRSLKWLLWPALLLALLLLAITASRLSSNRELRQRADQLWARVEDEFASRPGYGTVDAGFTSRFSDSQALLAWAEAPAGERVLAGSGLPFGGSEVQAIDHWETLEGILAEPGLEARRLPALQRVCSELRGSATVFNLLVAALVAGEVRAAVADGRLRLEQVAGLQLAPTLEDLRASLLNEAIQTAAGFSQELERSGWMKWKLGLLNDDWDRMRVLLAERALMAVDSESLEALVDDLERLEARYRSEDQEDTFWNLVFGDRFLVGRMPTRISRSVERLRDEKSAWEVLLAGDG